MYGIPEDLEFSTFSGCELDSITFTQNTIHFAFGESLSITLESSFIHHSGEATNRFERQSVPPMQSDLMRLIGRAIRIASRGDGESLKIVFDDGQVLHLFDDSKQFESFRIMIGEREIVV